ncbi:hypothetical protein ACQUJT_03415 [Ralstonia pseudosolanacearum]
MTRNLWILIALFASVFFPLHVLPPILSDAEFLWGAGNDLRQLVGLSYHVGFIAGAAAMLACGSRLSALWQEASRRWAVLALMAAATITLVPHPTAQILGRFSYGAGASFLLALFYREVAWSQRYDWLPKVFGYAAMLLETGGLIVGLVVARVGSAVGVMAATGLTLGALLIGGCSGWSANRFAGNKLNIDDGNAIDRSAPPRLSLSGSWVYMVTAMLAYAGFFLMLLTLGGLQGLDNGPETSGLAIFSTAFAFSAGNLVRFERWPLFAHPVRLVMLGVALSLGGSLFLWSSILAPNSIGIVVGAILVASGNGITVSRCFQRASISSPDGYSGPLITMTGVMVFTAGLSVAGHWLGGSTPMVQCLAFAAALATLLFGGHHANRRAHL